MKILSIGEIIYNNNLDITIITENELATYPHLNSYKYIIINGGDGTIRRVIGILHSLTHHASFILNPTGSFNVIAKLHKVSPINKVLFSLENNEKIKTNQQNYYKINNDFFLFSAGNMGDLQHIFLAETLRFGFLKKGILKYIFSFFFLLPLHIIMTPFMLLNSQRFFIFTPFSFLRKFGSFYGKIESPIIFNLENSYNLIELDGDIVTFKESILEVKHAGKINILQ